jgi:nucleotide-binding universal stress UspA family protein
MKYLVALDGSKDSEMAFDVVLSKATQEDHVFLLMVAEEVYISTVAGASAYIDYSYIVRANQKIEEEGKALLKSYGRRLTERKVLAPPPLCTSNLASRALRCLTRGGCMVKVAHTLLLGKGDPKDVVCREAEEREVDIIVIGRRGLGKFKRCAPCPKASGGVAFVRV